MSQLLPGFLQGLSSTESKSNSCTDTPLTVPTASTSMCLLSFVSFTAADPLPDLKFQFTGAAYGALRKNYLNISMVHVGDTCRKIPTFCNLSATVHVGIGKFSWTNSAAMWKTLWLCGWWAGLWVEMSGFLTWPSQCVVFLSKTVDPHSASPKSLNGYCVTLIPWGNQDKLPPGGWIGLSTNFA